MTLRTRIGRLVRALGERREVAEHPFLFALTDGDDVDARALRRANAPYRESVDAVARVVGAVLGEAAGAALRGGAKGVASPEIARRDALIRRAAAQVAAVDLLRTEGVTPAGVFAAGIGEWVAPYACGALSRDDTARVIAVVAHAVSGARSPGWRFVVDAGADDARRLCRAAPAALEYLGGTSPSRSAVLARVEDADAVRAFLGGAVVSDAACEWSDHAPRLEVGVAWMERELAGIEHREPVCPVYSAAAGRALSEPVVFDARFFAWAARRPVRYTEALGEALADGYRVVVPVGGAGAELAGCAAALGTPVAVMERGERMRSAAPRLGPPAPRQVPLFDSEDALRSYEELRRGGPVVYLPEMGFWLVLGYDAAQQVLADPGRFSSRGASLDEIDPVLIGNDPPHHAAVRQHIMRRFSAGTLARRGELGEAAAERLLRPLAEGRELDVVTEFANPLADLIVADVVGLGPEDVATFHEPTVAGAGETPRLFALMEAPIAAVAHRSEVYAELRSEEGGGFSDEAARSLLRLLWLAGTVELKRSIGNVVHLLLEHDEVRAKLVADPRLVERFVVEAIRLRPPEHLIPRVATKDAEIAGVAIPAGAMVHLCLVAANRDPARFADPDALQLDRSPASHLAFGGGPHRCVGAALAHAQTAIALRALLRAAPDFRAAQPLSTLRYARGGALRQLEQLVIRA